VDKEVFELYRLATVIGSIAKSFIGYDTERAYRYAKTAAHWANEAYKLA